MPTFLDSGNVLLNDTIAPKKRVFRNNIKTFAEDKFPNVGTTDENAGRFDQLEGKLANVVQTLGGIANLLFTTFDLAVARTTGIQGTSAEFSTLVRQATDLKNIVEKYANFNMFEPSQISQLGNYLAQAQVQQDAVQTGIADNIRAVQTNLFPLWNPINTILNITFKRMLNFIQGYSQTAPLTGTIRATDTSAIRQYVGFGYDGMSGGYSPQDFFQDLGDFGRSQKDNVYAFKVADDLRKYRTGGAIIPAFSQTPSGSIFGSDGYVINRVAYSDPRRFY